MTVEIGPGVVFAWQVPGQPRTIFYSSFSAPRASESATLPTSGAVLSYVDALKAFNRMQGV